MAPEQFIAEKALQAVKALWNVDLGIESLQVSATRKEFEGDYTLVVFPLLKTSRMAPEATAKAIGDALVASSPEIASYNVVKGFLNISLSPLYWKEVLSDIALDKNFGILPSTGKTIMVEYSSPNTNKPLHLGHVRNNLLGWSISQLLKAAGNNVIMVTLVNDRGIHICKSMLAWQKLFNGATPESTGKKGDHLVGDCYVAFNDLYKKEVDQLTGQFVSQGMSEEDAKAKAEKEAPSLKEAQDMLLKWEQGDPEVRALWQKMNSWVLDGFAQTYKTLGIHFDKTYFESQTYLGGKALVQKGLEDGVFEKMPDGSVWCDLTADGLDRKLLLRKDGTSVYMTQDLGTAQQRFEQFKLDEEIYVVGNEQNYHFQVLKLILGKLGFAWSDAIYHMSYGMVELPEGKMKSREGTVVDADELIEDMYRTAGETAEEAVKGKTDEMTPEQRDELFRTIGLGALKYFIIKVDPKKTMLFNPKESIDFNGNTGPFIQYTHARICSVLRKAEEKNVPVGELPADAALNPKEIRLVQLLAAYPGKVAEAAAAHSPALIANYAYELAKEFNQYYHDTPILREENVSLLKARLSLSEAVAAVLRKAASILGMELPSKM